MATLEHHGGYIADISLDGADLRSFDVDELRRHMMEALA